MITGWIADALATLQTWLGDKWAAVFDPLWIWYGWGGVAFAICLVIGFFLPFAWVRAGLGVAFSLVVAFIAGGWKMSQERRSEIAKLKAQLKAEKSKNKNLW